MTEVALDRVASPRRMAVDWPWLAATLVGATSSERVAQPTPTSHHPRSLPPPMRGAGLRLDQDDRRRQAALSQPSPQQALAGSGSRRIAARRRHSLRNQPRAPGAHSQICRTNSPSLISTRPQPNLPCLVRSVSNSAASASRRARRTEQSGRTHWFRRGSCDCVGR